MEVKFVIYIIGGILYFFYKKSQESKKKADPLPQPQEKASEEPKRTKPAYNPLDEVRQELQRKAAAVEAKRNLSTPVPKPVQSVQRVSIPKEILIHEKKKATFGEGANDAPVYERELLESEKTVRGDVRLKNEGIYRVETMEEARALADDTTTADYEFDAKQAFIGSLIFEKKF